VNEREVTALLERRASTVTPSDPPIDEIVTTARRQSSRTGHRLAVIAGAAVLAFIVTAGMLWDAVRDESSTPAPTDTPLPVHDGYRWVGMNGIAIEVPASWQTSETGCAPEAADAVVFDYLAKLPCYPRIDPRASSLHFETLDSRNFIAEMARRSDQRRFSIDGAQALRSGPVELNCGSTAADSGFCIPVFGVSIEVPSRNLLVWVESSSKVIASEVIASATPIPDGYRAVPAVGGMAQSLAADALGEQGLIPNSLCPNGGHVCGGGLIVDRTDPASGAIVAAGARVSMEVGWQSAAVPRG
jgi:hypothetical protein